ncbi:CYTH domain-containing protein [Microbacterium rhizomatis]|uniref:CYTH domain-containing protein n=1 Tax=Microbacterium rhizomatis TaxID=1631477 RepID=A0A5J5J692_9MICO|nr:CYTH domain-containing protein [Microbacterium rhizomatis]KAA9110949.1 CYTH domain-containing protein [Microbacterium rhizomatis]
MTGAHAAPDHAGASRSVEVERKFDVEDATPLPDWSALPGVTSVAEPERRELDARYLDTTELAMAAAGYALRRRTGGPDAGWHIKGPKVDGGRVELGWPLGDDDEEVPDAVRAVAATVTEGELGTIARILNTRTAYELRSGSGVVAEFVDDRVTATDARTGVVRTWREWEIELGPDAPADSGPLFAAVESAVLAAGGRPAASDSKLARALGH